MSQLAAYRRHCLHTILTGGRASYFMAASPRVSHGRSFAIDLRRHLG